MASIRSHSQLTAGLFPWRNTGEKLWTVNNYGALSGEQLQVFLVELYQFFLVVVLGPSR